FSGAMPTPSSVTSISMARWIWPLMAENDDSLASSLIGPTLGIASLAFTMRLRTACAKRLRSAHRGGRSDWHEKLIDDGLLTNSGRQSSCRSSNSDATDKTSLAMLGSAAKERICEIVVYRRCTAFKISPAKRFGSPLALSFSSEA